MREHDHAVDAIRYAYASNIHVLYSSKHWHIYWNMFEPGYKSYSVKCKKYTSPFLSYHLWINFGKGCFSVTYRPRGIDK